MTTTPAVTTGPAGPTGPASGGSAPRAIDVHAHFLPPSALAALHQGTDWFGSTFEIAPNGAPAIVRGGHSHALGRADHMLSLAERLERMDRMRVKMQVLSMVPPLSGYDLEPTTAAAMTRATNDELAAVVAAHPDRFRALAAIPAQDPAASVREVERAMGLAGFVGIIVMSHVQGIDWDDAALRPILEAAQGAGAVVFVHPQNPRSPALSRYRLGNLIGNPFDTTITVASLVFGGVLDSLPDLQLVIAHGGGYVPFAIGRFEHGYRVRPEAKAIARSAPRDYLRRFHFDTVVYDDRLVRLLADTMGSDRIVLGSDFPGDMCPDDPVGEIERNRFLEPAERDAILGGNLVRLLGLPPPALS